jgi:hypothetical protein
MSSDQEILRLQQILGIGLVCIALSLGLGGFDNFSIWHEWEIDEEVQRTDSYGDDHSSDTITFEFTIKEVEYSYKHVDSDGDSDGSSIDIDYGEYDLFEELEKSMPNIEKGGYLVIVLLGFILWKLQQMKTETNEEIRKIAFTQMINALKGAGVVVVVVLLYYYQGSGFEDDFDEFFLEDGGVAYCDDAWKNEPEFQWSGGSKYRYDNTECDEMTFYDTYEGTGKIDFTPKIGFFLFAGSLIPIFLAFSSVNSNTQLISFATPNVPVLQSQIINEQPNLEVKNPFAPKNDD